MKKVASIVSLFTRSACSIALRDSSTTERFIIMFIPISQRSRSSWQRVSRLRWSSSNAAATVQVDLLVIWCGSLVSLSKRASAPLRFLRSGGWVCGSLPSCTWASLRIARIQWRNCRICLSKMPMRYCKLSSDAIRVLSGGKGASSSSIWPSMRFRNCTSEKAANLKSGASAWNGSRDDCRERSTIDNSESYCNGSIEPLWGILFSPLAEVWLAKIGGVRLRAVILGWCWMIGKLETATFFAAIHGPIGLAPRSFPLSIQAIPAVHKSLQQVFALVETIPSHSS